MHAALVLGAGLVLAARPRRLRRPERRAVFEKAWQQESWDIPQKAWGEILKERRLGRAPLYGLLERALPRQSAAVVLELGCGPALDALNLADRPLLQVHALDLSQAALRGAEEAAEALQRPLTLHRGDVRFTQLPSGGFDLIFSQGLLEHFPDPQPVWREMVRLANAGGYVLVDVPQTWNPYTLIKQWRYGCGTWPWGWETQYTLGRLKRQGFSHGLEFVAARGYGYWGGVADLTNWARKRVQGRAPRFWAWWEEKTGAYWMMNVAVLFQKPYGKF